MQEEIQLATEVKDLAIRIAIITLIRFYFPTLAAIATILIQHKYGD